MSKGVFLKIGQNESIVYLCGHAVLHGRIEAHEQ